MTAASLLETLRRVEAGGARIPDNQQADVLRRAIGFAQIHEMQAIYGAEPEESRKAAMDERQAEWDAILPCRCDADPDACKVHF